MPKWLAQGKISFALDYAFVKIRGGNEPQLLAALRSRKSIVPILLNIFMLT